MKENDTNNATLEALIYKADGLDFKLKEAWMSSTANMLGYLKNRCQDDYFLNIEQNSLFATARLDWVLQNTVTELADRFSYDELITLMNCFQADLLDPYQLQYMASHLADDLGVEPEDENDLVAKLQNLSPVQRACLADVLERTWRAVKAGKSVLDFMSQIKFQLSQ